MRKALLLVPLAVVGSALAAQPTPPRWNPKSPENSQVVPRLNLVALEGVLTAVGARFQRSGTDPAQARLIVTFANGRRASISLSACDQGASVCKAMSIQTLWNKPTATPERVAQAVAQFNRRYALVKATVAPDGRPALQRYLVSDYGFVRGNLAVELLTYADQAQRFVTEVLRPLETPAK